MLVPGVGMFSFGANKQTARVAGEFYLNAINVMRGAEAISTYAPIEESEKFRIEYWALEEAKLARLPKPKSHATRIALVTGAASGIGKAIATRLAAEGACVVIADLNLENAQAVAAELGGADVAIGVQADVTDEAQVIAAIDAAVLAFGGLDLVVNNAGLSISKPLLETTEKDWDLQHNVMAKGSFLVAKAAAKVMIAQDMGGDIIYISSKNSVFAGPNNIAYSATKADQAHQVRLLAAELGEYGIRVNGINPDGVVRGSGIFAGGWGAKRAAVYGVDEQELGKYYAQRTLLKREVLPEHVANAAAVLTSARTVPHHRTPHPRGRRCGRSLPAMSDRSQHRTPPRPPPGRPVRRRRVRRRRHRRLLRPGHPRPGRRTVPATGAERGAGSGAPVPQRCGGDRRRPPLGLRRPVRRGPHGPRGRRHRGRGAGETITSIGIDTWAVDYGLVNAAGELTAQPYSYRDDRSRAAVAPVHRKLDPARLYATTGLQFLQFNTIYQLATEPDLDGLQALLIPDLIAFLLTGQRRTEATNASTTGLFDAVAGEWATEFLTALGLPKNLFPPLVQPGETVGTLLPDIAVRTWACRPAPRWWPSARTTPPPPSPPSPAPRRRTSPTSPPAPGPWWGWN